MAASFPSPELTQDHWALANEHLEDGAWYHRKMDKAEPLGVARPEHPHDPSHERNLSAAGRMMKAGNIGKPLIFHNRWARLAGYS